MLRKASERGLATGRYTRTHRLVVAAAALPDRARLRRCRLLREARRRESERHEHDHTRCVARGTCYAIHGAIFRERFDAAPRPLGERITSSHPHYTASGAGDCDGSPEGDRRTEPSHTGVTSRIATSRVADEKRGALLAYQRLITPSPYAIVR